MAILVILFISVVPACKKNDFSKQETGAVVMATAWLHLIDDGNYSESWSETAGFFRKSVSQERWTRLLASSRKPFGKVITRTLLSREFMTSLPGAPDGEYVIIIFRTVFRNKKQAVETITPMKDVDGKWRVSGYYIK